jgi:DNA-binding MarR family transcriptional regulator
MDPRDDPLNDSEFEALAAFRYELRRFFAFSESKARAEGLTVQQHQALLTIRGEPSEASIGTVAERLLIEHHSASELVKRLVARGLLVRERDPQDRRRVTLRLTQEAQEILSRLSSIHRSEIERMQPTLSRLLARLVRQGGRSS